MCTCRKGLKVSLGFFEDIEIPRYALPAPKEFDANEQLWWVPSCASVCAWCTVLLVAQAPYELGSKLAASPGTGISMATRCGSTRTSQSAFGSRA